MELLVGLMTACTVTTPDGDTASFVKEDTENHFAVILHLYFCLQD
jgi:hypothetical protein